MATEESGHWKAAVNVPGLTALNTGGNAGVSSVSCTSTGCVAGGGYLAGARESGFLVTQQRWSWQKAAQVPGLAALKTGGSAQVLSVSCTQSGWCAAVGDYTVSSSGEQRMFDQRALASRALQRHFSAMPAASAILMEHGAVASKARNDGGGFLRTADSGRGGRAGGPGPRDSSGERSGRSLE
ncbi:MAG TPA: hypothetical protein VFI65_01165 [Streptosporangiaceae bacterium]|nr:hypothetical protein [Streptosporangiaceae bacterium]